MTEQIAVGLACANNSLLSVCGGTFKLVERATRRKVRLWMRRVNLMECLELDYVIATLGHLDLIDRLKRDGIFSVDGVPMKSCIRAGYFALVKGDRLRILVTQEGQSWIARRYPPSAATLAHSRAAT